ncbi:MAG: OmpA family protein [Elusimicrobiota bacterium]
MNTIKGFFILAVVFVCCGCVSSVRYRLRETEVSYLAQENDELQKKVSNLEEENSKLLDSLDVQQNKQVAAASELDRKNKELKNLVEEREREKSKLKTTYDELVENLNKEIKDGEIKLTELENRLTVNLVDKILFKSGQAELNVQGEKVLGKVGAILKNVKDKEIRIEGNTDNMPIKGSLKNKYHTNWELSCARALNVAHYLVDKAKVDPKVLAICGYGEHRPIASNKTVEGRAKNRRIEIILVPQLAPASKE